MVRILAYLLGMLTGRGPRRPQPAWSRAGGSYAGGSYSPNAYSRGWYADPDVESLDTEPEWPAQPGGRPGQTGARTRPLPPHPAGRRTAPPVPRRTDRHTDHRTGRRPAALSPRPPYPPGRGRPEDPGEWPPEPGPRRPLVPRWVKWAAAVAVIALIFRRAVAAIALMALSGALHLVGINVHLPHIKLAWPWQTISAGTTTNVDLGPWVLQKIEGISKPALGQANFTFDFTHKVSKNIGFWPCWYASTFFAVGHASATVDLNPGSSWWTPSTGHYRLQVVSRPAAGKPGHVTVAMVLPLPQLPQSAHDVTIDNIPSKPIDTQHSWTYPGFGCGVLLKPQFPESVLYSEAQSLAYYKSRHAPDITRQLIATAENEAVATIRDNFVQPTVNALGYTLDQFTIRWASAPVR